MKSRGRSIEGRKSGFSVVDKSQRKTPCKAFRLNFPDQFFGQHNLSSIINTENHDEMLQTQKLCDMNSSLHSGSIGDNVLELQSEKNSLQGKRLRLKIRMNSYRNSDNHRQILQPINMNMVPSHPSLVAIPSNHHHHSSIKLLKENCLRKLQLADSFQEYQNLSQPSKNEAIDFKNVYSHSLCKTEQSTNSSYTKDASKEPKLANSIDDRSLYENCGFNNKQTTKYQNPREKGAVIGEMADKENVYKVCESKIHNSALRKKFENRQKTNNKISNFSATKSFDTKIPLEINFGGNTKGLKAKVEAFFWDPNISSSNDRPLLKSPSFSQKDAFNFEDLQDNQVLQSIFSISQTEQSPKQADTSLREIRRNSKISETVSLPKRSFSNSFSIDQKDKSTFEQAINFDIKTFKELIYRTNLKKNYIESNQGFKKAGKQENSENVFTKIEVIRPKLVSHTGKIETKRENLKSILVSRLGEADLSLQYNEAKPANKSFTKGFSRDMSQSPIKNENLILEQAADDLGTESGIFTKLYKNERPRRCSTLESVTSNSTYHPANSTFDGSFADTAIYSSTDNNTNFSIKSADEKLRAFNTQIMLNEEKLTSVIETLYNTSAKDDRVEQRQFFIEKATEAAIRTTQLKLNNKDLHLLSADICHLAELGNKFDETSLQVFIANDQYEKQRRRSLVEILKEVIEVANLKQTYLNDILQSKPVQKSLPVRSKSCNSKDRYQPSMHIATEGCIQTQTFNLKSLDRSKNFVKQLQRCSILQPRTSVELLNTDSIVVVNNKQAQEGHAEKKFCQDKQQVAQQSYEDFRASFIQLALRIRKEFNPDHFSHPILISDIVEDAYKSGIDSKDFESFIREKFGSNAGKMA